MRAMDSLMGLPRWRSVPLVGAAAVALAAIQVFVDWVTWIELNESIVYSLPLVLVAASRSRRLLWGLAAVLMATTFAVYYVQIPTGAFSPHEPLFINRVLAAVTLLVTAVLLHALTRAVDALEGQRRSLREQNERLEAANHELLRCREEITRQNEELDHRRIDAEEASGRKTRLLASVSHDIRSPVNAINLMAEVIRRTAADPGRQGGVPALTKRLQASALSLADLVTDVLNISSIESGRVELHESEFILNDLLTGECDRLLPLAQAKGVRLVVEPPDPPVQLRTDRVKLDRVLGNLVNNAIKFTDSGEVTVTAGLTPEGAVEVCVRDTGVGISEADLGRIFDEFAQVNCETRGHDRGWGLGLAICRRLIELMGGEITVESRPGCGSAFTVWLPSACVARQSDDESGSAGYGADRFRSAH